MILGIDTSADQCAVALIDGEHYWTRAERMSRGHAEALFPMIEAVLAEAGVAHDRITRIGVCTGPGSFTGVRAGVAAARGLALGLGVPAIGVSRLAALARASGAEGPLTVALEMQGGAVARQDFAADGNDAGPATLVAPSGLETSQVLVRPAPGSEASFANPVTLARIAAQTAEGPRPAPLYLRPADAAPPRDAPPPILPG